MKRVVLAGAAALALSGCATIVKGTSQKVSFQSDPSGSNVQLSTGESCRTPCTIRFKRTQELQVVFSHPGFKDAHVAIQSKFGGAIALNLLPISLFGTVVDASNGSSRFLSPNPAHVRMAAIGSDAPAVLVDKDGKDVGPLDDRGMTMARKSPEKPATPAK
ncbi:MAG: PEGA domain-containing protein [Sphingomonadales bacterium]|nr:PEGA domain-containing protein [Sphingomonadales bacterium]